MKSEQTLRKEKEETQVESGPTSRKLEKESGARKVKTQVATSPNSRRILARETQMRSHIKDRVDVKVEPQEKTERKPEERQNLTGQRQVNSRNNAACHEFQRYGNEVSEPRKNSHESLRGCFLYKLSVNMQ